MPVWRRRFWTGTETSQKLLRYRVSLRPMIEEVLPDIAESDLEAFFQITHTIYGYDFRDYARASVLRRLGTILKKYGTSRRKGTQPAPLEAKRVF